MKAEYRAVTFWLVCVPTRLTLASLGDRTWLRVAAAGVGATWLLGREMSVEGFFGGPAWWKEERPLHGLLWSLYALSGRSDFLYADTAFGICNWLVT